MFWEIFWIIVIITIAVVVVKFLTRQQKSEKENNYKESINKNNFIAEQEYLINDYSKIMLDETHKKIAIYNEKGLKCFNYEDLIDFEIVENGSNVIQSKVASTLVGGILLGGLGALAGANRRKQINDICNSLILKLYFSNNGAVCITEKINDKPLYKNSIEYKSLSSTVDNIVSVLKYVKQQADYSVYSNPTVSAKENNKIEDTFSINQIEKLAELKEKGIVTEQEFEESKKKILSKL